MAKSNAVWGIDIGQCALKALRCRPHEKDDKRIVVESFDYIEYPKILSQPEAEPAQLVQDALTQFLSRNDLTGDRVAISVAGQSGLARFIKLPPVESKKIPDIVKYEARQQIPFALEDVVWDYQQLTGGSEEDGFALEPEVGLFAMKRDQVARALQPLDAAGIEVDTIQLMPLAIYNYACFDWLGDLQAASYDPANPPESIVVISLGTDTTDLVVTNGYRVWQRNIPIGGSHFTRALSRELKLTFVKAEHLKRNAMQADNPKAVFQAMRPVFSDLLAEIQRSLGYFSSIDKTAKIGKIMALGNAMKLPGLQRYLSQNLEQEVTPIEEFRQLSAGSTQARSQFKDNLLSFAVAYGLCIQELHKAEIGTNLLPEEILQARLVRAKKPWAVAGIAALLCGLILNYCSHVVAVQETTMKQMTDAEAAATRVSQRASQLENENSSIRNDFNDIADIRRRLSSIDEGRLLWLELLQAVAAAVPRDQRPPEERQETAADIGSRRELHIVSLDMRAYEDLESEYFAPVEEAYRTSRGLRADDPILDNQGMDVAAAGDRPDSKDKVIQLTGYHYHNLDPRNQSARFVNETLIKQLEEGFVELPDGEDGKMIPVPLADLGISRPWIVRETKIQDEVLDPTEDPARQSGPSDDWREDDWRETDGAEWGSGGASAPIQVRRYDFIVQFCWQPRTRSMRRRAAEQRAQAEQEQLAGE